MSTVAGASTVQPHRNVNWPMLLLGIAACVLGLALLWQPLIGAMAFLQIVAVFWLATGVVEVLEAIFRRREPRIWHIVAGVLGVVAGLVVLAQPFVATALALGTLYTLVASMSLILGVTEIVAGLMRGHRFGQIAIGILQIVLGVILFMYPQTGAAVLVQIIALTALAVGVVVIATSVFAPASKNALKE